MVALLPNRAIFSPNSAIVGLAMADADPKFKTAAFKNAVVNRNEKVVKLLMVRSNINDYFLIAYGFNEFFPNTGQICVAGK